jgi:hypothetical protein
MDEVAEVVVNKRFTGTTVTIERTAGEPIVARGLKPDQADDLRSAILERHPRLRAAEPPPEPEPVDAPEAGTADGPEAGEPGREPATVDVEAPPEVVEDVSADEADVEVRLDESDLLAKLSALHEAGVLSDDEYHDKVDVVARLARGGNLAAARR